MSNTPKPIYRRPEHAGTKPVMRAGSPMRTIDTKRLARAGSVSRPVRRRALSKRGTVIFLSFLLGVLVVIAALVIATSERKAHAQTFEISAPCLRCVYLPVVKR